MKELQPCFRPRKNGLYARISKTTFFLKKEKVVGKSAEQDQQQRPADKGGR